MKIIFVCMTALLYFNLMQIEKAVVCLVSGYKINFVSFIGITFYFRKDGIKIFFLTETLCGMVVAHSEKENTRIELKINQLFVQGIIGIILTCVCFEMGEQSKNMYLLGKTVFFATILSIYISLQNYKLLSRDKTEKELLKRYLLIENQLLSGIRPKDLYMPSITLKEYQQMRGDSNIVQNCSVLDYWRALDKHDSQKIPEYIILFAYFVDSSKIKYYKSYQDSLYELIYFFSVIQPDPELAEMYFKLIEKYLVKDKSCSGKRVYAAYYYGVRKDKDKAIDLIHEGMRRIPYCLLPGVAVMEEEMLKELLEKCYLED